MYAHVFISLTLQDQPVKDEIIKVQCTSEDTGALHFMIISTTDVVTTGAYEDLKLHLHQNRHRAVIDQFHLHVGAELAGLGRHTLGGQ